MKNTVWIIALAVVLIGIGADRPDDGQAIQGNWRPLRAELGGVRMSEAVVKTIRLKLERGKYEAFVGDEPDRGTYVLDSKARPRAITVSGTEGPNRGKTFPAIYELDGDTLRICYDLSGAKRPAKFETTAGTRLYLVTYSRLKQ